MLSSQFDRFLAPPQEIESCFGARTPNPPGRSVTIGRRPARAEQELSTVVAADGIEPSRSRVWAAPVPCTDCVGIRGGICTRISGSRDRCTPVVRHGHSGTGWVRTSAHPFNKRPLNQLSFGPRYRCVTTPAAVAVRRAFATSRAEVYARAKSAMTGGVAGSKPTTSSIPASSGSAMLNPFDVIPTTTSLAGIPRASRYDRRA
jgi:hypothetical protein